MSEKIYTEIDCEGLATNLTDEAFRKETIGVPDEDVYEHQVEESGVKKVYRNHWANWYGATRGLYLKLITSFSKEYKETWEDE